MDVYIIEVQGKYKIGISEDIGDRFKALQTANPSEIILIHTFETNRASEAEKLLHKIFRNKRIRNEWFALTSGDTAFIRTINGFADGSFTWDSVSIPSAYTNGDTRPTMIFMFIDYKGREFRVTERQILEFLQVAWKRQKDRVYPLSENWWTRQKNPKLKVAHYEAIVSILVDNSIIINRHQGASGILSMPPHEAMRIITGPECNKRLTATQIIN